MISNYVYDTHRLMSDKNISLAFSGNFTAELINSILFMTKSTTAKSTTLKKVYNVMIECLENLAKHSEHNKENPKHPSIFILGNDEDFYYLSTGNVINEEDKKVIQDKIDKVNSLERSDLRSWYNDIIMNGKGVSDRGGAGLGIIDMALKAGNPLEYEFHTLEDGMLFYILKVKINIRKKK